MTLEITQSGSPGFVGSSQEVQIAQADAQENKAGKSFSGRTVCWFRNTPAGRGILGVVATVATVGLMTLAGYSARYCQMLCFGTMSAPSANR